ncbi:MAG TPA: hypothetical protein PLN33_19925 [Hyphomonadaceae bacterium]|nr:hypothetical protein [Hyphomonadaceae bacterium]
MNEGWFILGGGFVLLFALLFGAEVLARRLGAARWLQMAGQRTMEAAVRHPWAALAVVCIGGSIMLKSYGL